MSWKGPVFCLDETSTSLSKTATLASGRLQRIDRLVRQRLVVGTRGAMARPGAVGGRSPSQLTAAQLQAIEKEAAEEVQRLQLYGSFRCSS